ncbi:hypothetical protein CPB84DRAFT_1762780 [Gymnopilus junonius]|uniref:Ribosomal RNA methyltransferase FtsJ domain-containing protein n=1 Tax=Gymnopilus junonius TaxID=109634 RepID=A0A9P5NVP8_GYMJU|nr:hypothetical protein CPB84DRAFT_1762780 [Gymnopilus junonius]
MSTPREVLVRLASCLSPTSDDTDEAVRLYKALRLLELQEKGWHHEDMEQHFQEQRQTADTASSDLSLMWFKRMKAVLREIDQRLHFVASDKPLEFLDLGCCPGGFSSYVLEKNPNAIGYGISLPVIDGGHAFALEDHLRFRFNLVYQNLTYYQLGSCIIEDQRLKSLPDKISDRIFDLVLLDGHQLRTQNSALPWDINRLLISQLIIALEAVKVGGTIVIKLPLPHKVVSAKILYLLRVLSTKLLVWKPVSMHGNRGTFYAVAKGVGNGPEGWRIFSLLPSLKELWVDLTFGGDEGLGRFLKPGDLDFLVTVDDLIAHHLDWLVQLGEPLWKVQGNALRRLFSKKNIV